MTAYNRLARVPTMRAHTVVSESARWPAVQRIARFTTLFSVSIGGCFFTRSLIPPRQLATLAHLSQAATAVNFSAEAPLHALPPPGSCLVDTTRQSLGSSASALAYARRQAEPARTEAIVEIFQSIAKDRALVVTFGRQLLAQTPDQADADGTAVIGVLLRAGSFDAALDLAADGPEASRAEWLSRILPTMAGLQPEAATEIASSLVKQGIEGTVFKQVLRNWADTAPADAADFALSLPTGEARIQALDTTLDVWLKHEPAAVINWLPTVRERQVYDSVLATLVTRTDQVVRTTATALAWADKISDSTLRFGALEHVLQEWASQDRASTFAYLARATPRVTSSQQARLIALVNSSSSDEIDSAL